MPKLHRVATSWGSQGGWRRRREGIWDKQVSQVQQVGFVGKLTDLRIYAGMDTLRESVVRKKTGIRLFCAIFVFHCMQIAE